MDNRTPLQKKHHQACSELIGMHKAQRAMGHHLSPAGQAAFAQVIAEQAAKVDALENERQVVLTS